MLLAGSIIVSRAESPASSNFCSFQPVNNIYLKKYTDWYNFAATLQIMTKSEQTKAFIIETTAPLFNKKGYAGTSMSDITNATQLTKGCIYGIFANKDAVALAAFDHNLNKLNSIFQREMEKCKTAKEKLMVYGKVYANFPDYPFPSGGCPILNTATESDDTHPELRKRVRAALNAWKKNLTILVEEGIQAGEFSKRTRPEQVALTIIAIIEGGMMISGILNKPDYRTSIMHSITAFINNLE
ncbi:TetR family transcriptional regulator [Pseudobacter ginsenosidimutans]|uniref:TetR family transcriptional regulator n=1 Tax=Pseudobacter ginsenosidimutans TaxID=661488 RepID=A0A4Q7N5A9_9BACT|nr:TetR family transcriptional regulator [Pseudobacter ginsenosidimutans]